MNAPHLQSLVGRFGFVLGMAVLVPALGGCSRAHLTATHGRAYHEIFAAQDANPARKGGKPISGLDSQEAAIIAGNYRKALSPKADVGPGGNQLLMVNPNRGGINDSAQLAPSAPSGM
ncbi:MAG TPA: hypothetical protein VH560_18495 [Polyangia bacterium]|jgi:hypothetical protein|nr:hypothetical protein [Polyangia bacterium]